MALYPFDPLPSSISAPAVIDPMLTFGADQGYTIRRARHSRARRRFSLEYLGKSTDDMRIVLDFLQSVRLGTGTFEWLNQNAINTVEYTNSTPVILIYTHGLVTGQQLHIIDNGNPIDSPLSNIYTVTRLGPTQVALNGSVAQGHTGLVSARVYLPYAVAIFNEDTWAEPTKLAGPEQNQPWLAGQMAGYFNFTVTIEEVL